ncbi:MAG: AAA family ATPase, partial [Chloroflexota bacterium]
KQFFFIIDEINRGNLSKIFGELMMLIEADKRSKDWAIKLTYAESEEDRFYVPDNLYIIGTMNTADRSLALVDYALRRRFAFCDVMPCINNDKFVEFLESQNVSQSLIADIQQTIGGINQAICDDRNLGAGFQVGHSYFCTYDGQMDERQWFHEVVKYEIRPLLEEIWFDDTDKVEQLLPRREGVAA